MCIRDRRGPSDVRRSLAHDQKLLAHGVNANDLSFEGHAVVNDFLALEHADDFKLAVWEIKRISLGWLGLRSAWPRLRLLAVQSAQ